MMKIYISYDIRTESYHIRSHECDSIGSSGYYKITKVFIEDNRLYPHEFGAVFEEILKRDGACNCGSVYDTTKVISRDITKSEFDQIKCNSELILAHNR